MRRPVALLLPALEGGGAERVFLTLARALAEAGEPVDLVVGSTRGALRDAVPPGVRLVDLRRERIRFALGPLVAYLRVHRPRCLLSTLEPTNVLALVAGQFARAAGGGRDDAGIRVVVRVANTLSAKRAAATAPAERLTAAVALRAYRFAPVVVAPSRGVAEDLAALTGRPLEAVHVVPNPIVGPDLAIGARAPLDHPWFAAGQTPVVLGAGRLMAHKGFGELMAAVARVRRRRPVRLVILGEGPERAALEARARALGLRLSVNEEGTGDVDLPGFDPNPFRFMARAGVFVLNSSHEGLPGVLIQALACGAPVIAADCPSGPREILRDGRHGTLVPVGDTDALAREIAATLDHPTPPDPSAWQPYTVEAAAQRYREVIAAVDREPARPPHRRAGRSARKAER